MVKGLECLQLEEATPIYAVTIGANWYCCSASLEEKVESFLRIPLRREVTLAGLLSLHETIGRGSGTRQISIWYGKATL